MKLSTQQDTLSSSINNSTAFGVKQDEHIYQFLSSKLYSDKIGAVIRELSCNAYDSFIDSGNGIPFRVTLPSKLNPFFVVEDFGVGLSDQEVQELFATYMSSTKRDCNKQIGGYGIGSKSPFAYTDSFTVTARKDGKEVQYLCFMQNSVPHLSKLHESSTDAGNGVKVQVQVQESDIFSFCEKANRQLAFFPEDSITVLGELTRPEILQETEELLEIESSQYFSGWYVKQGTVLYRIESAVDNSGFYQIFKNKCIVLKTEMGAVKITPSRESLEYDESTAAVISSLMKKVANEYFKNIWYAGFEGREVDLKLVREAGNLVSSFYYSDIRDLSKNNKYFAKIYEISSKQFSTDVEVFECSTINMQRPSVPLQNLRKERLSACVFGSQCMFNYVILMDVSTRCNMRIRQWMIDNNVKQALAISANCGKSVDKVAEELGGMTTIKVSSMPEVQAKKRDATGAIGMVVKIPGVYRDKSHTITDADIAKGYYYVWSRYNCILDNKTDDYEECKNSRNVHMRLISEYKGKPVFILQSAQRKLAKHGTNLIADLTMRAQSITVKHIMQRSYGASFPELTSRKAIDLDYLHLRHDADKVMAKAQKRIQEKFMKLNAVDKCKLQDPRSSFDIRNKLGINQEVLDNARQEVYDLAEAALKDKA